MYQIGFAQFNIWYNVESHISLENSSVTVANCKKCSISQAFLKHWKTKEKQVMQCVFQELIYIWATHACRAGDGSCHPETLNLTHFWATLLSHVVMWFSITVGASAKLIRFNNLSQPSCFLQFWDSESELPCTCNYCSINIDVLRVVDPLAKSTSATESLTIIEILDAFLI